MKKCIAQRQFQSTQYGDIVDGQKLTLPDHLADLWASRKMVEILPDPAAPAVPVIPDFPSHAGTDTVSSSSPADPALPKKTRKASKAKKSSP